MFAPLLNHTILQLYILQQNIPGIDYKGSRHDQNRIQPGMQQLEVILVPREDISVTTARQVAATVWSAQITTSTSALWTAAATLAIRTATGTATGKHC